MSDDTDFITLYEELKLGAQCDLAEFKRAYRKRVTQLHPDHQGEAGDMPRLQRLNRMYDAALDFHREHGRLPGAPPARTPAKPSPAPQWGDEDTVASPAHASEALGAVLIDEPEPVTGMSRRRRYVLLLVLAGVLLYWWAAHRSAAPSLDPEGPGDAVHPGFGATVVAREVTVGMDEQQVRRILGAPTGMHDGRWDYGDSWVQFQCGQVVGWYSAPHDRLPVDEASLRAGSAAPHC